MTRVLAITDVEFQVEAVRQFDFLSADGFAASGDGHRVVYASPSWEIAVGQDLRDGNVFTIIEAVRGGRRYRAGLICLFVTAGLGPAQRVRTTARARRMLPVVLRSQADALREVLPRLSGADGLELLRSCHGRA